MAVTLLCFAAPALVVVLVATLLARRLARRAAETSAREAIAQIEREATLSETRGLEPYRAGAESSDAVILVRGKLVVDGDGCNAGADRWRRREKCAATAGWSSTRRLVRKGGSHLGGVHAPGLLLESTDGRVELRGAFEVITGSSVIVRGDRAPEGPDGSSRGFVTRTALFEGDEVVAAGLLRDGVLENPQGDRLRIVAAKPPRTAVSLRAIFLARAMWPAYFVALVAGGYMAFESRTAESRACRAMGECNWMLHSTTDADCRNAPAACLANGLCFAEEGRCVARTQEDCQLSARCKDRGTCVLVGDACGMKGEVHGELLCHRDEWLETQAGDDCGWADGTCTGTDEALPCKPWQRPAYVHQRDCVGFECATKCEDTGMCRFYGHCAPDAEGRCTPTAEGCAASVACKKRGSCTLEDERCVPSKDDADCARSEVCAEYGWCHRATYEHSEDHIERVCFFGGDRSWVD